MSGTPAAIIRATNSSESMVRELLLMVSMKEAAEYCTHHRASPGEDLPSTFCNQDHDDD